MKIRVEEIAEEPTHSHFVASAESVNERLAQGRQAPDEFRLAEDLTVDLTYYRVGEDLYFQGTLATRLVASCARCLGRYAQALRAPFEFVLAPARVLEPEQELEAEDLALSFFSGPEIDVAPLCGEQAILALPMRALCREDCRGLCPQCGCDRNSSPCNCDGVRPDPRWAVLREWKPPAS